MKQNITMGTADFVLFKSLLFCKLGVYIHFLKTTFLAFGRESRRSRGQMKNGENICKQPTAQVLWT